MAAGVPLRKALVSCQIAFTLILLIGAGLFVQTLASLYGKVEIDGSNLLMFSVDPPSSGYSESDAEQAMRELFLPPPPPGVRPGSGSLVRGRGARG